MINTSTFVDNFPSIDIHYLIANRYPFFLITRITISSPAYITFDSTKFGSHICVLLPRTELEKVF